MNEACKICGSTIVVKHLAYQFGHVLKCRGCGLVSLDVAAKGHDVSKETYTEEYFHEREDYFFEDGIADNSGDEKPHVKDFRDGLVWLGLFKEPPGKLLDIGCATGSFLSLAKETGWECFGVEISDYAASVARKKFSGDVFGGSFRDAHYPDNSFDVITMWDTIEHFQDPCGELQEAYRVLKADGLLLVNTPNEESFIRWMARLIYRMSFGMVKYPINCLYHIYHMYYFNITTMSLLLEKSGFQIVGIKKKVIPITRGRGPRLVKLIVKSLSKVEEILHAEYELSFVAQKTEKKRGFN